MSSLLNLLEPTTSVNSLNEFFNFLLESASKTLPHNDNHNTNRLLVQGHGGDKLFEIYYWIFLTCGAGLLYLGFYVGNLYDVGLFSWYIYWTNNYDDMTGEIVITTREKLKTDTTNLS